MFDLKNIFQMQAKAKEVQKKLAEENIVVEKNGVRVVLNGNQEIIKIELNPELTQTDQEKYLADCINEAIKKAQQLMAKMMMGV